MIGKPDVNEVSKLKDSHVRALVLHNDEVHTFDYVIDALVKICHHEPFQAEQCAFIVHTKGKCTVKEGVFERLKIMKDQLARKELGVTIE